MNKILIVEKEESLRALYAQELTEEGYDIISSNDTSALMNIIEEKKPNLIVMDIWFDAYKSVDLFRTIRNSYCALPIILCTNFLSYKYDTKPGKQGLQVVRSADMKDLKLKVKNIFEGAATRFIQ